MQYRVALRKESVDRNVYDDWMKLRRTQSLSARRAWIEIGIGLSTLAATLSRSPQGERG